VTNQPTDQPAGQPRRRERVAREGEVIRTSWLTPRMVRVVLGGPALAGFAAGEFTDHYVKLQFPVAGQERAIVRTYTVRRWDAEAGEVTIDFVVHGDEGYAGPWAAAARPGDRIAFMGPGGEYAPDPSADWHLLAGDPSALPAIAAALERVPAGVPAYVFLEVDGPDDEQKLDGAGDLQLTLLFREPTDGPDLLADAVRGTELPAGRGQAFVHGEAASVRALRRHLLVERGLPREALSVSGYWKRGRTEDGWREDKPEWRRLAELDERRPQ
jgi:NADPH-dependent ferric siderophore reductase